MDPRYFANAAYGKWGQPFDENAECIVHEMQADMMVLIGIIYALTTPDETVVVTKEAEKRDD